LVAARHRGLTLLVLCNDKTVCDDIRKVVATRLHKDKEAVGDDALCREGKLTLM